MKTNKKIIIFIMLVLFVILVTPIYSKATTGDNPIENPGHYAPGKVDGSDITAVTNKVGPIFGIITTIGGVVGVLVIIIIGIKYMVGSVEEKAEYKKTMIPYLIGAIMLISITGILNLFAGIISNITSKI